MSKPGGLFDFFYDILYENKTERSIFRPDTCNHCVFNFYRIVTGRDHSSSATRTLAASNGHFPSTARALAASNSHSSSAVRTLATSLASIWPGAEEAAAVAKVTADPVSVPARRLIPPRRPMDIII